MNFLIFRNEKNEETYIRYSQIDALQESDTTGNGDFYTKIVLKNGAEITVQESIENIVNSVSETDENFFEGIEI